MLSSANFFLKSIFLIDKWKNLTLKHIKNRFHLTNSVTYLWVCDFRGKCECRACGMWEGNKVYTCSIAYDIILYAHASRANFNMSRQ